MIITKQKNLEEILRVLGNGPVFLIGCSECATLCHTGGKDEIGAMKEALEKRKIPVSGCIILDPACHLNNNKRMLKEYSKEIDRSDKILVFACGNGVQTVAELFVEKEILTGTDTLFLGEISRGNEFDKRCMLCGECLLDIFGGFCPVTRCPKSMLNGPCGGSSGGKCEISSEMECVWDRIYQQLKNKGKLQVIDVIQKPKDWSKAVEMKRRV
ncbi:MAG: methylenetetrahydrofolate reductase C-terminal domain-containing protein [Thermoplasmata archaeon]|nr:methylenetetrahydrofolate reductase C-terminal domain-containing protein [Thermoplasmata archaeon]